MHSADVELAAGDGAEQSIVVRVEEVEAGIRAAFMALRSRQLVEFVAAIAGVFDGGEELQVAAVGAFQQFVQGGQAVNGFLHGGPFGFA